MRRFFDLVLLGGVLLFGGYWYLQHPAEVRGLTSVVRQMVRPCTAPITYSIGAIDARFKLATSSLVQDLQDAEHVWEEPSGKDLFSYVENGGAVTVSLTYDERQAATDTLKSMGIQIDRSRESYEMLKARYDAGLSALKAKEARYEAAVQAYRTHEAAYNAEVQKWNRRGGAPQNAYEQLKADEASLEREFNALKNLEREVNTDVDTVNALATTLNQLIVQLNINVAQYNRTGAATGEFEEGVYRLEGGIQTITIYEYSDRMQLTRVLAHEFGHALGMEHVLDDESIMYEVNQGKTLDVSQDDLVELEKACTPSLPWS